MRTSTLHPEGNGVVCCVCGDICLFDDFALSLSELTRTFFAEAEILRYTEPTHTAPILPPRTPSTRESSWVKIYVRGKTRSKNRER